MMEPDVPSTPRPAARPALARIAKLLRYASPYRARWVTIALLTLAASGLALIAPWPMQVLIDHALGSVPMSAGLSRVIRLLPGAGSTSGLIFWIALAGLLLFVINSYVDALLNRAWLLA